MQIKLTDEEMEMLLLMVDMGLTSSELLLDTPTREQKWDKMYALREKVKKECTFEYIARFVAEGNDGQVEVI